MGCKGRSCFVSDDILPSCFFTGISAVVTVLDVVVIVVVATVFVVDNFVVVVNNAFDVKSVVDNISGCSGSDDDVAIDIVVC